MLEQSQASQEAKQEIIDDLLKDLPSDSAIEIELPSECKIYKLTDPGAPITLRPMTFEDEKNIVGSKPNEDPINVILSKCVTNLNVGDLLSIDKLYLIMKLREISYGNEYKTLLICPSCKAENPITVLLSDLGVNPVPDDFQEPITVMLPSVKKEVKIRFPRVRDEKLISDPQKMMDQLWRFIEELGGHKDKSIISAVLDKLPLKDARTILNAMKTEFGIETGIKLECSECEEVSVVELPINANFFDVN